MDSLLPLLDALFAAISVMANLQCVAEAMVAACYLLLGERKTKQQPT